MPQRSQSPHHRPIDQLVKVDTGKFATQHCPCLRHGAPPSKRLLIAKTSPANFSSPDRDQYLPGTSTEPVFDQVMYASRAFIASESVSIFSPWLGFSMHQLIISRSA